MSDSQSIGRPKDPRIEEKTLKIALDLYGERGWQGFTFSALAERAGVGKSSIYARWPDKGKLLANAFETLIDLQKPTGETLQEILYNEAHYRLHQFLGIYSVAVRRLFLEATIYRETEVYRLYEIVFLRQNAQLKERLWEFKDHGIITSRASVSRLLDALQGSILFRSTFIAANQKMCFIGASDTYLEALVEDLLSGCVS